MPGEFRANTTPWWNCISNQKQHEEKRIAIKLASYGFKVASVDIIRSSKVLYWQSELFTRIRGIEGATNKDMG
jgi:hypothetical protein